MRTLSTHWTLEPSTYLGRVHLGLPPTPQAGSPAAGLLRTRSSLGDE